MKFNTYDSLLSWIEKTLVPMIGSFYVYRDCTWRLVIRQADNLSEIALIHNLLRMPDNNYIDLPKVKGNDFRIERNGNAILLIINDIVAVRLYG